MDDPRLVDATLGSKLDAGLGDSDGDGVSDRDERAAGSDPNDPANVPIDLSSLPDTPKEEPAAPAAPASVPNQGFWEQHYQRTENADGSVTVERRGPVYEAPDAYQGPVADMHRDSDGDGLTNYEEYRRRTDPKNPDTDGDGRSDGDEFAQGFDPTSPTPPNATRTTRTVTASVISRRTCTAEGPASASMSTRQLGEVPTEPLSRRSTTRRTRPETRSATPR